MKLLVVIAEYNPFHQGHKYQLEKAREESGASHCLILMGGNFLQRGEPAIEEKFIRARKALQGGGDLVAELPFIYASSWAREFAQGAIDIINKIELPLTLSFGSESGDLEDLHAMLEEIQDLSKDNRLSYAELIRRGLKNQPQGANDVLALEYLRALRDSASSHRPHTVKRIGQAYHGEEHHHFPSATSIRRRIREGQIPQDRPLFLEDFRDFIYSSLLTKDLSSTQGMIEGLEHRLLDKLSPRLSLEDYVNILSTRRYRPARIRRLLIHQLIGYTKLDHDLLQGTSYLRPLAYNKKGTEVLARLKGSKLPIVHPLNPPEDPRIARSLELDLLASRVYNFVGKARGEDYKKNLFIDS